MAQAAARPSPSPRLPPLARPVQVPCVLELPHLESPVARLASPPFPAPPREDDAAQSAPIPVASAAASPSPPPLPGSAEPEEQESKDFSHAQRELCTRQTRTEREIPPQRRDSPSPSPSPQPQAEREKNSVQDDAHVTATAQADGGVDGADDPNALKSRTRENTVYEGRATVLGLSVSSSLRRAAIAVVDWAYFDAVIMLFILLNSVTLAMDNPTRVEPGAQGTYIHAAETVFLIVFTVEMVLKVLALGFVANGPHSYLRSSWNRLDFVVVMVGFLQFVPGVGSGGALSAVRAARLLRPLRAISFLPSVRVLVVALMDSLPKMWNVVTLLIFLFFCFGLIGLQLFAGALHKRCVGRTSGEINTSVDTLCGGAAFECPADDVCLEADENPNYGVTGFDNIGQSVLTVFTCVTKEGWTDVMYWTFESVSYWTVLYFVSLMVFGAMFMVELVVAVIKESYSASRQAAQEKHEHATQGLVRPESPLAAVAGLAMRVKSALPLPLPRLRSSSPTPGGTSSSKSTSVPEVAPEPVIGHVGFAEKETALQTAEMRAPTTQTAAALTENSTEPQEHGKAPLGVSGKVASVDAAPMALGWRARLSAFMWSDPVEVLSLSLVVANTALMASEHHNEPALLTDVVRLSNWGFTAFFTLETALKLLAAGPRRFLGSHFDVFDAVIVFFNLLELLLAEVLRVQSGISTLRSLRLLRLLKIARRWKRLQKLLKTVLESLRHALPFALLLFLFVFIFAVLGMQLMAGKLVNPEDAPNPPRSNFDTFAWSMVSVFQVIGGENWNELMFIAVDSIGWQMVPFFVALFALGNYILLNLFLAILLSLFDEDEEDDEETATKGAKESGVSNAAPPPTKRVESLTVSGGGGATSSDSENEAAPASPSAAGAVSSVSGQQAGSVSAPTAELLSRRRGRVTRKDRRQTVRGLKLAGRFKSDALLNEQEASSAATTLLAEEPRAPFVQVVRRAGVVRGDEIVEAGLMQPAAPALLEALPPEPEEDGQVVAQEEAAASCEPLPALQAPVATVAAAAPESSAAEAPLATKAASGITASQSSEALAVADALRATSKQDNRKVEDEKSASEEAKGLAIGSVIGHALGSALGAVGAGGGAKARVVLASEEILEVPPPKTELPVLNDVSLWLFPMGPARNRALQLIVHPLFNAVVMGAVLVNTALLAGERANDESESYQRYLDVVNLVNLVTAVIFSVEAAMKIYAMGLVLHSNAYLRDSWNVLDFVVLVVSLCDIALGGSTLSFSIFFALPKIGQVLMVALIFYLIFGVLGVQLFRGLFYECLEKETDAVVYVNRADCEANSDYVWRNPKAGNFDNIFSSMLILFEMTTLEMWPDLLYRAIDTSSVDEAPIRDNNRHYVVYFLAVIVISNFFLAQLFLGVVVDSFNEMRDKLNGLGFLTPRQRMWLDVKRMFLAARARADPVLPEGASRWRARCFALVTSARFERAVAIAIVLSLVAMATEHHNQASAWRTAQFALNGVFSIAFVAEALLKIVALGMRQYFSYNWNCFDFALAGLSMVSLSGEAWHTADSISFMNPNLFRALRIPRVFRLIQFIPELRRLVSTLGLAIPSIINIGSLLLLVLFMFSVIGIGLFGGTPHGEFITVHANFDNVALAMLTLFRSCTGEAWNGIMHDLREQSPTALGRALAAPYFVVFVVIASFLMLNLFVAVLVESFGDLVRADKDPSSRPPLQLEDLREFSKKWDLLSDTAPWWAFWADRSKTQWLEAQHLPALFLSVTGPLGLADRHNRRALSQAETLAWIEALAVPTYEKVVLVWPDGGDRKAARETRVIFVHYFETLMAAAAHAFKLRTSAQYRRKVRAVVRKARAGQDAAVGAPRDPAEASEKADEIDAIPRDNELHQDISAALARRFMR